VSYTADPMEFLRISCLINSSEMAVERAPGGRVSNEGRIKAASSKFGLLAIARLLEFSVKLKVSLIALSP